MTFEKKQLGQFLVRFSWLAAMLIGPACAHNPAPSPASAAQAQAATTPEAAKTRHHLQAHVQYPASRDEILAACAQTQEFSPSEKKWVSDSLPDRTYASADEVLQALGM
jgi:hypothetical protein